MSFTQTEFSNQLISWYLQHKRSLPWRETTDPYRIWLSEILLQQTRVAQGLPYYMAFLDAFPSVFDLAKAPEKDVLKLWQGLGYYSRARNLHHSAKYIVTELGGKFPTTYSEILKLKGVGDYTASAIASICFNEPTPVVDGNVYRVLSRIFAIATPINSSEGTKEFKHLAGKLIDPKNPATHNQAIMEFGAVQCKPVKPACHICPFATSCKAFEQGRIPELPIKLKKNKIRTRHFNYLVFISEDGKTILQHRTGKGIWQHLYEFPLIETEKEETAESFVENSELQKLIEKLEIHLFDEKPKKHVLSHQKLFAKFWIVPCKEFPISKFSKKPEIVPIDELGTFPVPVLLEKFIDVFPSKEAISTE